MFKDTIKSAFSSLAPLWGNEIVRIYSLNNEYNIAITMILGETISFLSGFLNDTISMILICGVIIVVTLNFFGIKLINNLSISKSYSSVTVIGTEKYSAQETSLLCSKAFKSVNLMLIKKYNIAKLRYLKDSDFDIIVDDMLDYKLEDDLYVSVKRDNKDSQKIMITLSSYNKNIDEIIRNAINTYDDDDKIYKLKFVGNEINGTSYNYPEAMKYLTYVLVNNYKMSKLKILHETKYNYEGHKEDLRNTNDSASKENLKNANKKTESTMIESIDDLAKNLKNIYLLENCKNYKLEDDIFITIERIENVVTYTLLSNTVDLKDFLKKCIDVYKTSISVKDYKYVLKMSGLETSSLYNNKISYPKNLIALCDKLISGEHVNNFRMVESGGKSVKIIDDIANIMVDDILINSVRSIISPNTWERYIYTIYILESNTVNLTEYIEKCIKEYDIKESKQNDGIIYYFKYLGKFDKELKFSKSVLSSETDVLYETFDNIYNEHSDRLKNDIKQLKNDEYYKRTGLRRKKAYMFYGEPGCGKNASVVAMALHDKRHIVDIPFSILQYNSEFHEIMNLTTINGVSFRKDQVIFMFDEMHTGLAKICKGDLKKQNVDKENEELKNEMINTLSLDKKEPVVKMTHDTLDLGCVLSLLDGIGNYGGVIYVGLTNYIDKIPEPLKRSLRLTPVYFTYLRQCDVVKLIEVFYDVKLTDDLIDIIPDRKITPARLRVLCEQNEFSSVEDFVKLIIKESEFESREFYCNIDNTEKILNADKNKNDCDGDDDFDDDDDSGGKNNNDDKSDKSEDSK